MMKIGITCPASLPATQFGGIMFLALDIAKGASSGGHDTTIYTTDLDFSKNKNSFNKSLPRTEEHEGVQIKRAHVYVKIKLFFINPGIYNLIKNDSPDVIHAIGIRGFQSIIAALISKWSKIPLILSDQGGLDTHPNASKGLLKILYKLQEPVIKMIIKQASKIIAANDYEKDIFLKYCDSSKITVIENGIDVEGIVKCPFDFKKRHKISRYLLFLGRFAHVKGPDVLLQAVKRLKATNGLMDHKIVIMGSDFGFEKKIFQMIDELGLGCDTMVIRNPAREEVIAAYHGCEFLVLPSRWEMSPLTPVEGFACKKTTISARAHGIPYIIRDGENGLLFNPEDHEDLAEKISCLLESLEMREKLATNGHQMTIKELTKENMSKKIIRVYEEAIMDHHEA